MFTFLCVILLFCEAFSVNVQGPVFVNTTWKRSKSPYVLVGDYQVARGVTLTISKGTEVIFLGDDNQLLIKGNLLVQGSSTSPVKFSSNGSSSSRSMILFRSTNLSGSFISQCQFTGPRTAIQLGEESEHQQDSIKNSADLQITYLTLNNSRIQTNGYSTRASLTISNANILNSTIIGVYPRSERIFILKSKIRSSLINSDSYNDGIKIDSSQVTDCRIVIGCCGANVAIDNSQLKTISVTGGDGGTSLAEAPFKMSKSIANGLNLVLPSSYVFLNSCQIINNDNNQTIQIGFANIVCSQITGNQQRVGIEITSTLGYTSADIPQLISRSTISKFRIGISLSGIQANLTINNTNLYQNTEYNLHNVSPRDVSAENNWWGKTSTTTIRNTIFDYYKNINYGEVRFNNFLLTKLPNKQC